MAATAPQSGRTRLELVTSAAPDETVVKCRGRLTSEFSLRFKESVKAQLPNTRRLVLDLTDLTHMDSSGLGALVAVYVSAKSAGCELRLVNLNKQIRDLLGLAHLLSAFEDCGKYMIRVP